MNCALHIHMFHNKEMDMNKDIAQGKWEQLKGSIKEQWGDLTDNDITEARGSAQRMAGILQEKYGKTREVAEREVDEFWTRHGRDDL